MTASILGYCDRDSVRPGDRIEFKVSCESAERFRTDFVRLGCCETPPEGPGFREKEVKAPAAGEYPGRRQTNPIGSCVAVPGLDGLAGCQSFTLQAMVLPTRPGSGAQAILGAWNATSGEGVWMGLDETGAFACTVGNGSELATQSTDVKLVDRHWYLVSASYDAASGILRLHQEPVVDRRISPCRATSMEARLSFPPAAGGRFLIAAWDAGDQADPRMTGGHFDGKIDRPRVSRRFHGRRSGTLDRLAGRVPGDARSRRV